MHPRFATICLWIYSLTKVNTAMIISRSETLQIPVTYLSITTHRLGLSYEELPSHLKVLRGFAYG